MADIIKYIHQYSALALLLLITFKTVILLAGKYDFLDNVRSKTKVLDMILGTLVVLGGFYLMFVFRIYDFYIILKIVLVFLAIPLGIVGLKKKNKILSSLSVITIVAAYGIGEAKPGSSQKTQPEVTVDAEASEEELISKGQTIYTQICVNCHGEDGKLGAGGAKDLSATSLSTAEIADVIRNGQGANMPDYGNTLSEEQIKALSLYVKTLVND